MPIVEMDYKNSINEVISNKNIKFITVHIISLNIY